MDSIDRWTFNEWFAAYELDPWDDTRIVDALCNGFATIVSGLIGEEVEPDKFLSQVAYSQDEAEPELVPDAETAAEMEAEAEIAHIRMMLGA